MRALGLFAVLFVCGCQSGVSIDIDGGLAFPCTPTSATARTQEQCPGNLFCGFDGKCHPPDVGGAYACREDFHCGGDFRCGAKQVCVDPSADALRADAPDVQLSLQKSLVHRTPWDAGITALGVGRSQFQPFVAGQLTDSAPIAVANGRSVYSVATSRLGLTAERPPKPLFVGRADLPAPVSSVVAVRDTVVAVSGDQTFIYRWAPAFDGGMQSFDPGVPLARVGTQLRAGNSGYPIVFEFTPDAGTYRWIDSLTSGAFEDTLEKIEDMTDTDGTYAYAIVDGQLQIANRRVGLTNGFLSWGTFAINSPGRDVALNNCSGGAGSITYRARSLHIGDNPDLSAIESPLVGVAIDVQQGDAGVTHWMRIDPDPLAGFCGTDRPRHIARGICPACSMGERFVDMQWGIDGTGAPMLRAECAAPTGETFFYDLQTDSTGYACFRARRIDVGPRGQLTQRSRTSSFLDIVAARDVVQVRRNGFDGYLGLTLDRPPEVAQSYRDELVAFTNRVIYRETPVLGAALVAEAARNESFPAWIAKDLIIYDDGRVGPISNLDRPPQEAAILGSPLRMNLSGPFQGKPITTSDGRTFLVMAANDTLLGADLSDAGARRVAPIEVKAVPESEVGIRSIAILDAPSPDAGVLFEGYVLTDNRLFTVAAQSDDIWTLTETDKPSGKALEAWSDSDRARIGYEDGKVYSLPSGVVIAPATEAPVRDFEQHCGRSYALTADALYRLDAVAGAPVGEWTPQAALPDGPRWARMYTGPGGELWVFALDGTAVLLKGAPCTQ